MGGVPQSILLNQLSERGLGGAVYRGFSNGKKKWKPRSQLLGFMVKLCVATQSLKVFSLFYINASLNWVKMRMFCISAVLVTSIILIYIYYFIIKGFLYVKKCFIRYQISADWPCWIAGVTHIKKSGGGQSANDSSKWLAEDKEARWGCWCMWLSAIQLLSSLQIKHLETRRKWTVELSKWTQASLHTTGFFKIMFIFQHGLFFPPAFLLVWQRFIRYSRPRIMKLFFFF